MTALAFVKRLRSTVAARGRRATDIADDLYRVFSGVASGMVEKEGVTRSYKDFLPIADRILSLLVKNLEIESSPELAEIVAQHKQLVCAQSHGPALGPVVYTLAMCHYFNKAGGGDRVPVAITHRLFYQMPMMNRLVRFITQVPHAVGFDEFVELFNSGEYNDLCLMPEGDHCNFGNGLDVMPFKSPRFVEIALRSRCPILIIAHAGGEAWGKPLPVPDALLDRTLGLLPPLLAKPMSPCALD